MLRLNRAALEALASVSVHALTDVTGFGLLGHLHYLARASGLAARVAAAAVPALPGAEELCGAGEVPSGTRRNERFLSGKVRWAAETSAPRRTLLADAQTSGGLLIAIPPEQRQLALGALSAAGAGAHLIGELSSGSAGQIEIV
jgi:selenide,water dikinase